MIPRDAAFNSPGAERRIYAAVARVRDAFNHSRQRIAIFASFALLLHLITGCTKTDRGTTQSGSPPPASVQTFSARGIVKSLKLDEGTIVIQHEKIPNYMIAMTMPFKVKEAREFAGLQPGDEVAFRLLVTADESWIDQISKTGRRETPVAGTNYSATASPFQPPARHPLLGYEFTNELGQPMSLNQFRGQALAITFFFTRCPVPDYCPRLSRNFEEAAATLNSTPSAPTNWHFLSVSFDTAYDTPPVLKAYGQLYHYDPTHWSFLTGPEQNVLGLARQSGVSIEREGDLFNHSFRTLILDAAGHLQTAFPVGGNLSDNIVREILKAAAVTNAQESR